MKFTHVCGGREIPNQVISCLNEQPARSGMYNWIQVFKGEINTYWSIKDDLEKYDALHINMTPRGMSIIQEIRNQLRNSSTKLILNNDYVCEAWGKIGLDPLIYDQAQKCGDLVFSTEPYTVSNMINGTFLLPHPSNTKSLKHLGTDYEFPDSVGFINHWWNGNTYLPNRTLELVKKKFDEIKKSAVYGYVKDKDEMGKFYGLMFDRIEPLHEFTEFAQRIQGERIVFDPNPAHNYGRGGVEMACFKKPMVGSNRVYSCSKLFPELVCNPFDCKQQLELFGFILNNPNKVDAIMDRANEDVEYFNYKNSKERFMEAFDTAVDRGGWEWYLKNG